MNNKSTFTYLFILPVGMSEHLPARKGRENRWEEKEGKVPYTSQCSRCHAMFWNPAIKKKTGPCSYGAYSLVGEEKCVWLEVPLFITWPNIAASMILLNVSRFHFPTIYVTFLLHQYRISTHREFVIFTQQDFDSVTVIVHIFIFLPICPCPVYRISNLEVLFFVVSCLLFYIKTKFFCPHFSNSKVNEKKHSKMLLPHFFGELN